MKIPPVREELQSKSDIVVLSVALVRERTIPTERSPPVGEIVLLK
jgi:hypothetical protein